jgi:hypothetical protein
VLEGRPCPCAAGHDCCAGRCVAVDTCPADGGPAAEAGVAPDDGAFGDMGVAQDGPVGSIDPAPATCPPAESCAPGLARCGGPDCTIKVNTDHDNCGHCGHGCRDGECQDGTCQATAVASFSPRTDPPPIAVNGAGVYWGQDGAIVGQKFGLGTPTTIANTDGEIMGLTVDENFAYFMQRYGVCSEWWCIRRVALTPGSTPEPPLAQIVSGSTSLLVDANAIYWFEYGQGGAILRLPISASGSPRPQELAIDQGMPTAATIDGEYIYWGSRKETDGIIKRASLDGQGGPENLVTGLGTINGIAVDSDNVYWTEYLPHLAKMAAKRAGARAITVASLMGQPMAIAAHGTFVYWAEQFANEGVRRFSRCSGEIRQVASAPNVMDVLIRDGYLYFSHSDHNQFAGIRRLAP